MHALVHIFQNNKQEGPYTAEEIQRMLESGAIAPITLAWADGMPDWAPLSTVLARAPQPTQRAASVAPQALAASEPDSTPSLTPAPAPLVGPKGVGGWLLLFCVGLTIIGPLLFLSQTTEAWRASEAAFSNFPGLKTAVLLESLSLAVLTLYGFIAGAILWGGNPGGRSLAKRYLLIRVFAVAGIEVMAVLTMGDQPTQVLSAVLGGVVGRVFGEVFYFIVWWFYFKNSKRVRNTYGAEA